MVPPVILDDSDDDQQESVIERRSKRKRSRASTASSALSDPPISPVTSLDPIRQSTKEQPVAKIAKIVRKEDLSDDEQPTYICQVKGSRIHVKVESRIIDYC